jgi:hypothetical protein
MTKEFRLEKYLGWLSNANNHMYRVDDSAINTANLNKILSQDRWEFMAKGFHKHMPYNIDEYFGLCRFGDVRGELPFPGLTKARGFTRNTPCNNNIIFFINHNRHWKIPHDIVNGTVKDTPWSQKQNKAVWRGSVTNGLCKNNPRLALVRRYHNHEFTDVGFTRSPWTDNMARAYTKPEMTIEEQLTYKYAISVEGHDTATNLQWIMASSSLAIMPVPKRECWFLESCLIPWVHFVPINDTMDDLEERIEWCNRNEDKCQQIVRNANEYVSNFLNREEEEELSTLVLKNYFDRLTFVCTKEQRKRFGSLLEGKKNVVFE